MTQYAIVRHSAYETDHAEFEKGLQTVSVTAKEAAKVLAAGGFVGDYTEAEDRAEAEQYPPGYQGLIPQARGEFLDLKVGGLPVYKLPVEGDDVNVLVRMVETVQYQQVYTLARLAELLSCLPTHQDVAQRLAEEEERTDVWLREDLRSESSPTVTERSFTTVVIPS